MIVAHFVCVCSLQRQRQAHRRAGHRQPAGNRRRANRTATRRATSTCDTDLLMLRLNSLFKSEVLSRAFRIKMLFCTRFPSVRIERDREGLGGNERRGRRRCPLVDHEPELVIREFESSKRHASVKTIVLIALHTTVTVTTSLISSLITPLCVSSIQRRATSTTFCVCDHDASAKAGSAAAADGADEAAVAACVRPRTALRCSISDSAGTSVSVPVVMSCPHSQD